MAGAHPPKTARGNSAQTFPMKPNLLDDVLHEGAYTGFREELLRKVEVEARRKRFARGARWIALAAGIAILFVLPKAPSPVPVVGVRMVADNPIVIRTAPLKISQVLESRAIPNLVIETDHTQLAAPISDSELLALFPKKPVGLASTVTGARRLLFLNPADERRFMSSN
jgi:hypothetical protein